MTQVYHPAPRGELWVGVNGTAQVFKGAPLAVLSSGKRVKL